MLLHVLATTLMLKTAKQLLPDWSPLLAAGIFAVHPIHVEAVTSVVGRADILASISFLISFLCFLKHVKVRDSFIVKCATSKELLSKNKVTNRRSIAHSNSVNNTFLVDLLHRIAFDLTQFYTHFKDDQLYFRFYIIFAISSVLCKEVGLTVIPLAICYDIILYRRSQHIKSVSILNANVY